MCTQKLDRSNKTMNILHCPLCNLDMSLKLNLSFKTENGQSTYVLRIPYVLLISEVYQLLASDCVASVQFVNCGFVLK